MSETQNFPEWKSLQGTTLEGGYELKEIVEATQDHAVLRVRVLGDYTLRANAVFYALAAGKAEDQIGLWQTVRNAGRNPNISLPLGLGILRLNGTTAAYLVFQSPDETLGEVLRNRALSPEEATDVLRSVARGLGELHANGLVHGNVSPEEVFAIRDAIDISTEGVRRVNAEPVVERKSAKYLAPESGTQNVTIASDVWCLGATVFEALTQKTYEPGLQSEAAALKHPFGTLVACCLEPDPDKRCKLGDLEGILRSKMPPAKPVAVTAPETEAAKAAGAVSGIASSKSERASGIAPTVVPPAIAAAEAKLAAARNEAVQQSLSGDAKPTRSALFDQKAPAEAVSGGKLPNELARDRKLPNELDSERARSRNEASVTAEDAAGPFSGRRGWIYAIAAFVAIFLILWVVRSRPKPSGAATTAPVQSTAPNSGPDQQSTAAKTGTAWPTKTLTPDTKTVPAHPTPMAAAAASSRVPATAGMGKAIWRVVLYTYNRQQDAESKAQAINGKHSDLAPAVFAPNGSGGPYLVVAGGQMNRDGAAKMRQQAIREGMPHDTYIQNYSR